jgi:hypothetical protein
MGVLYEIVLKNALYAGRLRPAYKNDHPKSKQWGKHVMPVSQGQTRELQQELENIYSENYSKLYACVFRMTGNHQDTEDVLQNSFMKAFKNLDQFKENSKLSTWVYRILLNESYRYFETIKKQNLPLIRITGELGISEGEFYGVLSSFMILRIT